MVNLFKRLINWFDKGQKEYLYKEFPFYQKMGHIFCSIILLFFLIAIVCSVIYCLCKIGFFLLFSLATPFGVPMFILYVILVLSFFGAVTSDF